jgi:hypothetical protein
MTPEQHRERAEQCLLMAAAEIDPDAALKLRQLAADYIR